MKVPAIKKIVESYTVAEMQSAEEMLMEEQTPSIDIEGDDEGEKLTHVMASIFIKTKMQEESIPFTQALRAFTQRVRNSIS